MTDLIEPHPGKLRTLSQTVLARRLRLSPERRTIVQDGPSSTLLLARLRDLGCLWDQVALLSYALPEREAVWWACMCVLHTARDMPAVQHTALDQAQGWVRQPDEAGRAACRQAAKAAGAVSGPAYAARAAFRARPSEQGCTQAGRMVEAAIRQAAGTGDPAGAAARLGRFIGSGEAIAAGGAGRLPPEQAARG